jgi:hypothetical protein
MLLRLTTLGNAKPLGSNCTLRRTLSACAPAQDIWDRRSQIPLRFRVFALLQLIRVKIKMTTIEHPRETCPFPSLLKTRAKVAPLYQLSLAAAAPLAAQLDNPQIQTDLRVLTQWITQNAQALEASSLSLPRPAADFVHSVNRARRDAIDARNHADAVRAVRARLSGLTRSQRRKIAKRRRAERDGSPSAPPSLPFDASLSHEPTCVCRDCAPALHCEEKTYHNDSN